MATLLPQPARSVRFDESENVFIEGDNLEVLKLLQSAYLGKIKMIYIDPPYNTGNDFIYPDNYAEALKVYLTYTGQADANGRAFGTNIETNGRFHSKWLNMMFPRLYLARDLLTDDGVIAISINDVELSNLLQVLDEIFGESNRQSIITWRRRHNQPNDATKMIATVAEYIVIYAKDSGILKSEGTFYGIPLSEARRTAYKNPDKDPRGAWDSKPWKAAIGQGGSNYTITSPSGAELTEDWLGSPETYRSLVEDNRIYWPKAGEGLPRKKFFLKERDESGQAAHNFWGHEEFGSNQEATLELKQLFDDSEVFDSPKPVRLVQTLLALGTHNDDMVLDFFAGSGTTAEAVLRLNQADGGNRRFILVQLPEPVEREGYKTIADITIERIKRAATKLSDVVSPAERRPAMGLRVFSLAESNVIAWNSTAPSDAMELAAQLNLNIAHLRNERSELDILFEILLKEGLKLSTPVSIQTIADASIYSVTDGAFIVYLGRTINLEIIDAIAALAPQRVFVLDEAFEQSDQLKANTVQAFKGKNITLKTL